MHYKNGREAKLLDRVVKRTAEGQIEVGIVVGLTPGQASCNISLAAHSVWAPGPNSYYASPTGICVVDAERRASLVNPYLKSCENVGDYLHVEDALAAFEKASLVPGTVLSDPDGQIVQDSSAPVVPQPTAGV